jgi:hypothetical protein
MIYDDLTNPNLSIADSYMFFTYENQSPTEADLYKHDCGDGTLLSSKHFTGIKDCGSVVSFSTSSFIYMLCANPSTLHFLKFRQSYTQNQR